MQVQRTTLRLEPTLKKQVFALAAEQNTSMQAICNQALRNYIKTAAQKTATKILFKTHDLGTQFDNLTRDDYYDDSVL